jgi:hypothetical protein
MPSLIDLNMVIHKCDLSLLEFIPDDINTCKIFIKNFTNDKTVIKCHFYVLFVVLDPKEYVLTLKLKDKTKSNDIIIKLMNELDKPKHELVIEATNSKKNSHFHFIELNGIRHSFDKKNKRLEVIPNPKSNCYSQVVAVLVQKGTGYHCQDTEGVF